MAFARIRFGKWINVHFDSVGRIRGAEIQTYLLEKARVIHQTPGERNYHIFYQLCCAAKDTPVLQDLGLADATVFNYTKGCITANNVDDEAEYKEMKEALTYIGFDEAATQAIFGAVSACLHVGNLAMEEDKDGNALIKDDSHLVAVASLLNVESDAIRKAICSRMIHAGGEVMVKPETYERANQCRDALAKALYNNLFEYLVSRVNSALDVKGGESTIEVSVLDIFGFEVFQINHFEQFCINHANEKLQLHFNHYNFMLERELYAAEDIEFVATDFQDNSECIDLLEAKGWGIQATLDDVCNTPKGDDTIFLERLLQSGQMKSSKYFTAPKVRNNTFVVNHYAGSVAYNVEDFCEKNKDALAVDLVHLVQGSTSKFLQKLFEEHVSPEQAAKNAAHGGDSGHRMAHKSVSMTFKQDLGHLMDGINLADPHFVRCVNPNAQKKAECFEDQKAVEQLRCGGVIESVRMCRESYPSRFKHLEFTQTFLCVCPGLQPVPNDSRATIRAMVNFLKTPPEQFRLGKTLVLLKREAVETMEKLRAKVLGGSAKKLQCLIRDSQAFAELHRKRQERARFLASLCLQGAARRKTARSAYYKQVKTARFEAKKAAAEEEAKRRAAKGLSPAPLPVMEEDDEEEALPFSVKLEEKAPEPEAPADEEAKRVVPGTPEAPAVSPLCIRIQVHAEGVTEALLFHVDLLASAIRQAVHIKEHKALLQRYPNTFRGVHAVDWLRGHAARALFGPDADKEKYQELAGSVALLLGHKLLAVGVFQQVTGSKENPLEDPQALFRFQEDEREGPLLNCRSIWFQNARDPLLVVQELLYAMINLQVKFAGKTRELRDSDDFDKFTAAAAELQLVNINDLSRIQLLAFFLNCYNLMVLHAHTVRGQESGREVKARRTEFMRDNQYMVAAYNYSLEEIEERLFCRDLRAKFPKKSDKSRAPEPRVHFALSYGCADSPRIRIYQPESLDEQLEQSTVDFLANLAPKNQARLMRARKPGSRGVCELVLPKVFKWYKDDFGFTKAEALAFYAGFMQPQLRDELLHVARGNNFVIKYDSFDWNLDLVGVCAETAQFPGGDISNGVARSLPAPVSLRKPAPPSRDPATIGMMRSGFSSPGEAFRGASVIDDYDRMRDMYTAPAHSGEYLHHHPTHPRPMHTLNGVYQ